MIKLISFVLFVISYFMQEGSLDCTYVDCEGENSRNREKTFYLLHASKPQFSPYFLLKRTHTYLLTYIVEISFQIEKLDPFQRGIPTYMKEFLFFAIAYHSGRFDIYSMFYTEPYTNDLYIMMR